MHFELPYTIVLPWDIYPFVIRRLNRHHGVMKLPVMHAS
jgi:hypothetical protein